MMGYVLVYVLWMIAFLGALIFFASYKTVKTKEVVATQPQSWSFLYEARALAKWGIYLAVNSPDILRASYGAPYYVGDRKYLVYVSAEEERLSLRLWGPEVFEKLLLQKGFEKERAKEMAQNLYDRLAGIKRSGELLYIPGFDTRALEVVRENFTLLPTLTNINYVSEEILEVVGFSKQEIDYVKNSINERGFVSFDGFLQTVSPQRKDLVFKFVFTPLPIYYRVKVVMDKPFRSSLVFVMTSDGSVYDVWEE